MRNHQIDCYRSLGRQIQKSSERPMVSPINGCRIKKAQYIPKTSPRHVQHDSINGMLQNSKLETPKIVNNLSLDFCQIKNTSLEQDESEDAGLTGSFTRFLEDSTSKFRQTKEEVFSKFFEVFG